MNLSNVLQALCTQLMDYPNEPYLSIDDIECDDKALEFLLLNNLVQRHSDECRKIKLLDPRTR